MIEIRNYWGKDGSVSSPAGGSQALCVTADLGILFGAIFGQPAQQPALPQPCSQPSNLLQPLSERPQDLLAQGIAKEDRCHSATEPGTLRRVA